MPKKAGYPGNSKVTKKSKKVNPHMHKAKHMKMPK